MATATKYIISGNVQGVFFRATARDLATELGLKGSVKNLSGGAVELIVMGNAEPLIEKLKHEFKISSIKESPCAESFKGFSIV